MKSLFLLPILLATSFIQPQQAKAAGCYPNLALQEINTYLHASIPLQQAYNYVVEDGLLNRTDKCNIKFIGTLNEFRNLYPRVYSAGWPSIRL